MTLRSKSKVTVLPGDFVGAAGQLPRELFPLAAFMLRHLAHAAERCDRCGGTGIFCAVEGTEEPIPCAACLGKKYVLPTPAEVLP